MSATTTMSFETPTMFAMPPNRNRRNERAKRAQITYNREIPNLLRTCPRAKHGVQSADLIVDPPANPSPPADSFTPLHRPDLRIRVLNSDTLAAAARMSSRPFVAKRTTPTCKSKPEKPNVCVLNMASSLRPGGGFLDGANSQEEFLCARTTMFPSLWDSFYPLPDVSGVYSPDVLVFRNSEVEADDLSKRDRYFVDVLSSSMVRFSDAKAEGCSCGVSYCDRHRDLVIRKMKAVMRIAQSKGVQKLVLGAWGCGANGNPVKEIAKAWRKVIVGAQRQRKPNVERWEGINEVVFAIPDRSMLREFEVAFQDVLSHDPVTPPGEEDDERVDSGTQMRNSLSSDTQPTQQDRVSELITRIAETEVAIETNRSVRQRQLHRETLTQLRRELALGLAAKGSKDEDVGSEEDDQDADDYSFVVPGSDEEGGFYHLSTYSSELDDDENNPAFDSPSSVLYEFRPSSHEQSKGSESLTSHDEETDLEDANATYAVYGRSPRFDPDSGWFHGSVDELSRELMLGRGAGGAKGSRGSPGSPVLRPESGGISEEVLGAYLKRYEGT